MKDLEKINKIRKTLNFKKTRAFVDSSNVDRVMYNDETRELTIRFLEGSTYTYFDIDEETFQNIIDGQARAKTTDSQNPPRWRAGQSSVGAGVHQYLIERGVRYEQGGNFR